jgi:hypothetical protein
MKIVISGATGFIGGFLRTYLLELGHELVVVTRDPKKYESEKADNQQFITWDATALIASMETADVIINLAGESIFGQRWTDEIKRRLMVSRVDSTRMLVDAAIAAKSKPALFISASAVGIYGDSADKLLTEDSAAGSDFLAKICLAWEEEAHRVKELGIRLAIPRIGIVLHPDDGALQKMVLPFKLFAGGPIGDGKQFVPWIHMHDTVRAIAFPIENTSFEGPYNVCAPEAVSNEVLSFTIGKVLNRPSWIAAPKFALNIILGEAAQPVLNSLRVQPEALLEADFSFTFEDLEESLADLL